MIDPTQNVLDLVQAAISRQDDLREGESEHIRQILDLRTHYMEKLSTRSDEIAALRAEYERELAHKESERIDAIRAVDVGAVSRAAEVSAAQAATLATQATQTAEALRGQVEGARIATETRLAAALAPITESIENLRQAQYQQQGEKSVSVPIAEQLAPVLAKIEILAKTADEVRGRHTQVVEGRSAANAWQGYLGAGLGVIALVIVLYGKATGKG